MRFPLQKKQTHTVQIRRQPVTTRAPVYSYHARRSQDLQVAGRESHRVRLAPQSASKMLRYMLRRFGAIVALFVAAISIVSISLVSSDAKIELSNTSGGVFLHTTETYQAALHELLLSSLMDRTKLTIDTSSIIASMKRKFPELGSVAITLPLVGHRPIVTLMPAQPVVVLVTHDKRYLVDNMGRVFGAMAGGGVVVNVPNINEQIQNPPRVGDIVLPTSTISFLQLVIFQLQQKHVGVSSMTLPQGLSELDIYPTSVSYYVKFNLVDPSTAVEQAGAFLAVRHYLQAQGSTPQNYIDVRIPGRVYYK